MLPIDAFCDFCLNLPHATMETPFDEQTLAFKVGGKIFALCNMENFVSINVKNTPENNLALREQYDAVQPGYHMSKVHWNTISFDGDMPTNEVLEMVKASYALVKNALPKKIQATLG